MRIGDLDDLKENIEIAYKRGDIMELLPIIAIIDNAPTVEVPNYAMGYQDGVRKVLKEVAEGKHRTQGEWIFNSDSLTDDMIATHYCSICGKGAYSGHDNYCWNCGAEMRGDTK